MESLRSSGMEPPEQILRRKVTDLRSVCQ